MADFVTHEEFVRRFPMLVLDQRSPPKKREALVTLLVSATIGIEIGQPQTESCINDKLQAWVDEFGGSVGLDRVTVRRMLVDEGLLYRDRFGRSYVLRGRSPHLGYDPSIRSLDLRALVEALEQQRAERRRAYPSSTGRRA